MSEEFDRAFWQRHWQDADHGGALPVHPFLAREVAGLSPGAALEAGCGTGAEALWLAAAGWEVTGADVSAEALSRARAAAEQVGLDVTWVEADLTTWEPPTSYDLVTTHYAHPAMPQLDFYARLAGWVAPAGTLLVVGHRHGAGHGHAHDRDHGPPEHATVTAQSVRALFDSQAWEVVTAEETDREVRPGKVLRDVVVRAVRRG